MRNIYLKKKQKRGSRRFFGYMDISDVLQIWDECSE